MSSPVRRYKAGDSVDDFCRACKIDRLHAVIAADAEGRPLRVACGFCRSEHNYRGGPRIDPPESAAAVPERPTTPRAGGRARLSREPFPIVSDRERTAPPMPPTHGGGSDIEMLLRRVIREESGITAVTPAEKWRGGALVLRPGTPGLQEKTWPIETFFHKVVMVRNRLRTLEQQVNAAELPDAVKVRLQSYISGCYGSLTSFNILFAEESDQFKGAGGD
ncbi:MAG: hypothetical protein HYS05_02700 [Acidobacteria bacterium]|nr:hypothetical protein [Acidobacteriota bacterium]